MKRTLALLLSVLLVFIGVFPVFAGEDADVGKYAVEVILNIFDGENGGLLPVITEFSPADFALDSVSEVIVGKTTAMDSFDEAVFSQEEIRALKEGIPTSVFLLLKDESLSFAENIRDYLMAICRMPGPDTDMEKFLAYERFLSERVTDARVVRYDGKKEALSSAFGYKVWVRTQEEPAGGFTPADFGEDLVKEAEVLARDKYFCLYFLTFYEPTPETFRVFEEKARGIDFVCGAQRCSEILPVDFLAQCAFLDMALPRPGDADLDGKVTSADARLTLRAAVGLEELDKKAHIAADIDGKEGITSADARAALRAAVGLEDFHDLYVRLDPGAAVTIGSLYIDGGSYAWEVERIGEESEGLYIAENYIDLLPPEYVGGGVDPLVTLIGARPGKYTLQFTQKRSWEEEIRDSFFLTVVVEDNDPYFEEAAFRQSLEEVDSPYTLLNTLPSFLLGFTWERFE